MKASELTVNASKTKTLTTFLEYPAKKTSI